MIGTGVSFSTKLFDLDGLVELVGAVNPTDASLSRRVSSTPTLDGSAFVSDVGYAVADREFNYSLKGNSKEFVDNVIRIAQLHSRLILCTSEGAFEVVIKSVFYLSGVLRVAFVTVGAA